MSDAPGKGPGFALMICLIALAFLIPLGFAMSRGLVSIAYGALAVVGIVAVAVIRLATADWA